MSYSTLMVHLDLDRSNHARLKIAGELAEHFDVTKPAMSAHFAVLREAGLVASMKRGQSVVYELQMSVLEDALLGFAKALQWNFQKTKGRRAIPSSREVFER